MKKFLLLLSIIAMSIFFTNTVYALTATDTINVSANAVAVCSVSAQDINFGDYDGQINTTSSDIVVTCTTGVPYNLALDAGQNYEGSGPNRRMSDGSGNYISYTLGIGSGYVGDIGYGDTFPFDPLDGTGTGAADTYAVSARALASIVPAGAYSDIVTVTVNY